ncbi:large conductance mechanosensitive channel protein MscL [Compostimonas suwonensis]|uniref:Large-conductance mechanosensitive channel n=1 Tax=Compostimonas suwonensis TaxID=1048394 RepID=A0A2M9BVR9_9MICO|nr:large conductance mechanosensitive channel protein MscL [Compostimonas suwonensis]PJJ62041.1 large conductance mechanosensitive channel [Compostimonas suwonensis]
MIQGFKEFIVRGNVIDLAVAVVIGAAFTAVVNAIVTGIFNPLIGAIFQADSLDGLSWTIPGPGPDAVILYGSVIGAIIQFLIVAVVVYFVFVMPINHFKRRAEQRRKAGETEPADTPPTELDLLIEIRDLLAKDAAPREHKHAD